MLYCLDVYIDVPDIIDLSHLRSKGPQAGEELLPEAGRWILLGLSVSTHSCYINVLFICHICIIFGFMFQLFSINIDCACMRFVYLPLV